MKNRQMRFAIMIGFLGFSVFGCSRQNENARLYQDSGIDGSSEDGSNEDSGSDGSISERGITGCLQYAVPEGMATVAGATCFLRQINTNGSVSEEQKVVSGTTGQFKFLDMIKDSQAVLICREPADRLALYHRFEIAQESHIDLGCLKMTHPGVLSGKVLRDSSPVHDGIMVTFSTIPAVFSWKIESNKEGYYKIESLPPGTYILHFSTPHFATKEIGDIKIVSDEETVVSDTILLRIPWKGTPNKQHILQGTILHKDTTWSSVNTPLFITEDISVSQEATLTIAPGTHVVGRGGVLYIYGKLHAQGTSDSPVVFENTIIVPGASTQQIGHLNIQHAYFLGGELYSSGHNSYPGSIELRDSILRMLDAQQYIWYPLEDCYIERNLFLDSPGLSIGIDSDTKIYISNNVFFNQQPTTNMKEGIFAIQNWASYSNSQTIVEHNSFLSSDRIVLRLESKGQVTAKNNYWGSTNIPVIENMIYDKNDDLQVTHSVEYKPILDQPHHDTPDPSIYLP